MKFQGKKVGMLGGGQLGRMAAKAASRLGIDVIPYDPAPNSPAFKICGKHFNSKWDNTNLLKAFAKEVDVITYEFENVPIETINFLQEFKEVWPKPNLLEIAQHRLKEKSYLNSINIPTTRYAPFENEEQLNALLREWGSDQCIIKTSRFGYDGKGQAIHRFNAPLPDFIDQECIIEEMVDFDCEISVIVARDLSGSVKSYPPALNEHKNGILHKTTAPAPIDEAILENAIQMAERLAREVSLVGVLTIELFVTKTGQLLANEIAPRPHNSGHWTIDACACDQFEQQIRAVSGLPLGSTKALFDAEMINLIGNDIEDAFDLLKEPNSCVHIYGKEETRTGRKMGHVTRLLGPSQSVE